VLSIDDLVVLTSVKIDRSADGVYEETWTNGTDFVLEPYNAASDIPRARTSRSGCGRRRARTCRSATRSRSR
jgi:hypothetical protein